MKNSTLTVVGTGIKFLSHVTTEAKTYIEKSDKVLYLVNEPAMKQWIENLNINSESLDSIYFSYRQRSDAYKAITEYILRMLEASQHICVAVYGHPSVFSKSVLDAVIQAKNDGYDAKILPGISAEDCLFADLLIDPGTCGCQSYETTDFLLYHRMINTSSHLILWQPDVIGALTKENLHDNHNGIRLLVEYLGKHYAPNHEVIVYEAAQYPGMEPSIMKIELSNLPNIQLSPISTLYLKPNKKLDYDPYYAKKLISKY